MNHTAAIMPIMHNSMEVYKTLCQPLCTELHLPQTALDILLFLANNPDYNTARDIVRRRGIQPNLVSRYVDLLVQRGYLERQPMAGDRRSIQLRCTKTAQPVIDSGHLIQKTFLDLLFDGIPEEDRTIFQTVMQRCGENIVKARMALRKEKTV